MRFVRFLVKQIILTACLVLPLSFSALAQDNAASALFERAEEQALLGDLGNALATYAEGLELDPTNVPARIRLAHLQRNASKRDDAIATLKAGLKLNNESALLHVRLGELLEAADDPANARQHYDRASQLEPSSQAGIDAAANLADLETRNNVTTEEPSIGWSKGPKKRDTRLAMPSARDTGQGREFMQLDDNLSGDWCLEWTDRYRRDGAMCVSDPTKGDLDLKDFGAEVSFIVDANKRTVSDQGLESATGMALPKGAARSIERTLGNRTVVQTLVFDHSDFLEFTFGVGNHSRQCMQVMTNRRGDEHRLCANRYTFCRCTAR